MSRRSDSYIGYGGTSLFHRHGDGCMVDGSGIHFCLPRGGHGRDLDLLDVSGREPLRFGYGAALFQIEEDASVKMFYMGSDMAIPMLLDPMLRDPSERFEVIFRMDTTRLFQSFQVSPFRKKALATRGLTVPVRVSKNSNDDRPTSFVADRHARIFV